MSLRKRFLRELERSILAYNLQSVGITDSKFVEAKK